MLKGFILFASPSPKKPTAPVFCFFNRQASYMSNLGVSNRFFWDARSRLTTCCHGERAEPWELSRPEKSSLDGSDFVIIILKEKTISVSFYPPKKWRAFWEISWVFPELVQKIVFCGNFKTLRNFKFVIYESMKWWQQKCHVITSWVAYFWAHSNGTLGPLVPPAKIDVRASSRFKRSGSSGEGCWGRAWFSRGKNNLCDKGTHLQIVYCRHDNSFQGT